MKPIALLFLVCVRIFAFSQPQTSTSQRLLFGVSFEANYVNQILHYKQSLKLIEDLRHSSEKGKGGGAIGLNLEYSITPAISLGTGLLFLDRGYATKKKALTWISPEDLYPTHGKTVLTFYFVETPLKVTYNFNVADFRMYVTGGPSIGHLVYTKTSVITYFRETRHKAVSNKIGDGYTNNILSFHVGLGINVPLAHGFKLSIEPLYRQTLTSLSHHNEGRQYFHSIGINTHFFLTLKR